MHARPGEPDEQQAPVQLAQIGKLAFGQHHGHRGLPLEPAHRIQQQITLGPLGVATLVKGAGEVPRAPGSQLVQVLQR